ncbi:MAG: tyrosine--tRNA ligase [Deltaproteobacteria bacterium]|nr:tyrosine--tRNA ligase [Deltaproteobacteria bacterium]
MENVIEVLEERGFIDNKTHEQELRDCIDAGPVTCYVGFDPTADSLHIGHLVPIMSLAHMQRCGHRPIALVGGGTGLVGDPSGKTEMRQILTPETVENNVVALKGQLSHFIDFRDDQALLLNNADWLTRLEYIPFLRDVGRHFSVNRMLKAESYRMRLESDEGLNFIEFNYMLLQAYDFLALYDRTGCQLQMGGSDQWGNIVAGIELVRKMRQAPAFGITFRLITTASGAKMGKTAAGAVWLDAKRTSPYDYYQYWINTDDQDTARFLALYTFLPMEEIRVVEDLEGADLNAAKAILAFEATAMVHGPDEALKAYQAASSVFGARDIPQNLLPHSAIPRGGADAGADDVPHSEVPAAELRNGIPLFKMLHQVGLTASGGASRRLITQGGAYVNGERIPSIDYLLTEADLRDGTILLRCGKKKFHRLIATPD